MLQFTKEELKAVFDKWNDKFVKSAYIELGTDFFDEGAAYRLLQIIPPSWRAREPRFNIREAMHPKHPEATHVLQVLMTHDFGTVEMNVLELKFNKTASSYWCVERLSK